MDLKELIKKRIEENVSRRDLGVIESYEYLIELIAIEYHTTEQLELTAVVQAKPEGFYCERKTNKYYDSVCEMQCRMCAMKKT